MKQVIAIVVLSIVAGASGEVIWDNGTFATNGVALSIGWNQSVATPYRYALTDDFVLTSPTVLTRLTTWGFMQGNSVNQPQVIAMYVRILADNGGQPGAAILGGFATGLPFTETYTGVNYVNSANAPIYRLEAELPNWTLCAGHYWIQYNVDQNDIRPQTGNADANYFSTLVSPPPSGANGFHYSVLGDQYFSLQGNAPPFSISGTVLPACGHVGDFDGDDACTGVDIEGFVGVLIGGGYAPCADFNGDCTVDGADVAAFVACLLG